MFASAQNDPLVRFMLALSNSSVTMKKSFVRKTVRRIGAIAVFVVSAITLLTFTMPSHAIEEPSYKIVQTSQDMEVREYAAYTVAEVVVAGPASDAGNQAFPILAGYIFGKNKGERKFAMTAPVTQAAVPVRLAMTAPVTQTPAPGGFLVQFVLPKDVTLASAPEPTDPQVKLREVPPSRLAVIRFSGLSSQSNYDEHLAKLQTAMRAANLPWSGEPIYSRYNAPFTPGFLRRNEIWLQVAATP